MERVGRPSPEEYQPRISRWGHTWRLGLMLMISGASWAPTIARQSSGQVVLDLAVGIAAYVVVLWRRRWPLPVAIVLTLAGGVSGTSAGPGTLASVSLATRRRWAQVVGVGALGVVVAQVYPLVQPTDPTTSWWVELTVTAVVVSAVMAWGMYIGSRRELIWTLRHRAERAEAEQELRVAQSRGNERARIAREMHDVLAHRISQIALHAGALSFRADLTADQMRASAGVIQEKAHEALTDLRGVLGVLRDDDGRLLDAPQPTYADLVALVEDARGAGLNVEYDDRVDREQPVPDIVGRTVFRIVQEGITNARKHAPGARLRIEVAGSSETGIDVRLSNPVGFGATGTPGAGLGLVGLAERAELRGGRLEHRTERRPDGRVFVLHGWLPWAA